MHGVFEHANKNNRYAWRPENLNFAPRLGIAYLELRTKSPTSWLPEWEQVCFVRRLQRWSAFDQPGEHLGFSSTTNWIGSQAREGYIPSNLVSNPFRNGLLQPVGTGAVTYCG